MIGVIDVGGGLRGIYGAGVFDRCLEENIQFDLGIGVSAGSANLAAYFGGQKRRNYKYYTDYTFRKEYMSLRELVRHGSYLNLDYIYGTLSNSDGEYPLDYDAMQINPGIFKIVATDAMTGKPVYFDKGEMPRDDLGAIKCSSCIPVIGPPYKWMGNEYFDGGLSDPIPVRKAFEMGCDKVVVVLTKPKDFYRQSKNDITFARLLRKTYPKAAKRLAHRAETYNRELRYCHELEKEGKVLIVSPDSIKGLNTLTKDKEKLIKLYLKGYHNGGEIKAFVEK